MNPITFKLKCKNKMGKLRVEGVSRYVSGEAEVSFLSIRKFQFYLQDKFERGVYQGVSVKRPEGKFFPQENILPSRHF